MEIRMPHKVFVPGGAKAEHVIVKRTGKWAFAGAVGVGRVSFAEESEVEAIEDSAFRNCSLTDIRLPESLRMIEVAAFQGHKLARVEFDEDMEFAQKEKTRPEACGLRTDSWAFQYSMLKSITLPAQVTHVHSSTFVMASELEEIFVSSDNKHYRSYEKCLYSVEVHVQLIAVPRKVKSLWVHRDVREIGPDVVYRAVIVRDIEWNGDEEGQNMLKVLRGKSLCSAQITVLRVPENLHHLGILAVDRKKVKRFIVNQKSKCFWDKPEQDGLEGSDTLDKVIIPAPPEEERELEVFLHQGGTKVTLDECMATIGCSAFENSPVKVVNNIGQLERLVLLYRDAFAYSALEDMCIPQFVSEIGVGAFECRDLKRITVCKGDKRYVAHEGVLYEYTPVARLNQRLEDSNWKLIVCPRAL